MKHTETYAYHEACNWLDNDERLQSIVSNLCRHAWDEKWSDERIERKLRLSAIACGFLGWRYDYNMTAISRRSIAYWAKETWEDYKEYKTRNAEVL